MTAADFPRVRPAGSLPINYFIVWLYVQTTIVLRLMMDITAVILIVLSLGSWIMWDKVRKDYKAGYFFFAAGILISGYYLFLTDFF